MILSEVVGVLADDLTGANDTALQFHLNGAKTKILLDNESVPQSNDIADVWTLSSESRNCSSEEAIKRVEKSINTFKENFNFDFYYKKIDSTLRGHIALETLTMVELLDYDAAIVVPAFPQEGRITVGGYHLLKGVPLGRSEMALDPLSPIYESHVPTLLRSQLGDIDQDLVGTIDLKIIMNGAGPILVKLNDLINEGKKIIVADATSLTDIEQISLAIKKSEKKILPVGTAAMAQVLSKYWLAGIEKKIEQPIVKLNNLPSLIISGSATNITAEQINYLRSSDDFDNINYIDLTSKEIISILDNDDNINILATRIIENLKCNITVVVHTSNLVSDFDGFSDDIFDAKLTKENFANLITDYLAKLTKLILSNIDVILITLGGETSYKCCKAINSNELVLIDEVTQAISLTEDINSNWIITKSGNLGNRRTLIEILNYLKNHE